MTWSSSDTTGTSGLKVTIGVQPTLDSYIRTATTWKSFPRETLAWYDADDAIMGRERVHSRRELDSLVLAGLTLQITEPKGIEFAVSISPEIRTRPLYLPFEHRYARSDTEAVAYAIAASLLPLEMRLRREIHSLRRKGYFDRERLDELEVMEREKIRAFKLPKDPWEFASMVMQP